jgi:hypothetical protein
MKDKIKGGFAVDRTMTSLVLAAIFLLVSGANAFNMYEVLSNADSIQDVIDIANDGDTIIVHGDGVYAEDLLFNKCVTLRGIDNPVLTNGSPGGNVITIDVPDYACIGPDMTITGFTIKGIPKGSSAAGILVNASPDLGQPLVVYNNIVDNTIGFKYSGSDLDPDPILNYWGKFGIGANRGMPGEGIGGNKNNPVSASVNYVPWLTAEVINGKVTNSFEEYECYDDDCCDYYDTLTLENGPAGITVELSDGSLKFSENLGFTSMGSAIYNYSPDLSNSSPYLSKALPGIPIKFFNVFINHYEGPAGNATVDISYTETEIAGVFEDTLTPYVLVGNRWIAAKYVEVDGDSVHGTFATFPNHWADGSIIALVGQSYRVTIEPPEDTSKPIQKKPVLTKFEIESTGIIDEVFYQIDSTKGHWTSIDTSINSNTWMYPSWNITDDEWSKLTNATHTIYFKFTDGSEIGGDGAISWKFVKGGKVPPVSPVQIISPIPGQKLSRTPVQIKWTLPSEENIDSIEIWFDRYGDFNMNGGLNNPLHLASLGGGTTYSWRSPNIQTDTAKILVVVTYMDGTEYYGISENFSIVKGYSFKAYKKAPKPVYNIGSGISQGVATIGAWFHKPKLPFLI